MNKIASFFVFSAVVAVSLAAKHTVNGVPVLVNEYMYDIPVHHTPLRAKYPLPYPYAPYAPYEPYAPYPAEEPVEKLRENYGLPTVIEIIVPNDIAQREKVEIPEPVPAPTPAPAPVPAPAAVPASESSIHPECVEDEINGPGENREPVVTNYKFELPPTPTIVQPALQYGVPEIAVSKIVPAPAPVYGVPEVVVARAEPEPKEPAPVYGVPEVIVIEAEPAPTKSDDVPEVVVAKVELAPGKPALEYGVPQS